MGPSACLPACVCLPACAYLPCVFPPACLPVCERRPRLAPRLGRAVPGSSAWGCARDKGFRPAAVRQGAGRGVGRLRGGPLLHTHFSGNCPLIVGAAVGSAAPDCAAPHSAGGRARLIAAPPFPPTPEVADCAHAHARAQCTLARARELCACARRMRPVWGGFPREYARVAHPRSGSGQGRLDWPGPFQIRAGLGRLEKGHHARLRAA